jgi:hypothetical protein
VAAVPDGGAQVRPGLPFPGRSRSLNGSLLQCAAGLGARGCERPQPIGDESLLMAALAPAALALATGAQLRLRRRRGAGEAGLAAVERGWCLSHVAGSYKPRPSGQGSQANDVAPRARRIPGEPAPRSGAESSSSVISITSPGPGATPERRDARRPASSPGFDELYGVPIGPDQRCWTRRERERMSERRRRAVWTTSGCLR